MEKPVYEIKAWRVTFDDRAPSDDTPYLNIAESVRRFAVTRPLDVSDALVGPAGGGSSEALDLIWLPPSAGPSQDIEKSLESEAAAGPDRPRPPIRASLRSTRVMWTDGRALIATAPDQLDDAIDAVVRFTAVERRTREIERAMAEIWPRIDALKILAHHVTRRHFALQDEIDALAERSLSACSDLMRLETAIEQLDPTLASGSKRLFAELVLQAAIYDRLEMLEDPTEFASEHFENANDRLREARYAHIGFYLETMIVVVLLAELVAFAIWRL